MNRESLINFRLFVNLLYWSVSGYFLYKVIDYQFIQDEPAGAMLFLFYFLLLSFVKSQHDLERKVEDKTERLYNMILLLGKANDQLGTQGRNIHKLVLHYMVDADEKAAMLKLVEKEFADDPQYAERIKTLLYQSPSDELAANFALNKLNNFMTTEEVPEDLEEN